MRHEAERVRWGFFAANAAALDEIYDQLVKLRHGMARKLGFQTYTPLGYRRLRRVDYGPDDVARYRDQVVRHVVPLVGRLLEARRAVNGWDRLRFWDEALIDPAGNPKPAGDHDTLVDAARTMFDGMDPRLASFYRLMSQGGFMDLKNRPGKAGGGFCTSFPTEGVPFIFANFNGTHHDIGVFTHEMGHAFQNWESREQPGVDYLWPTMEAAEINSMGLEFLSYPGIGLLVGEAAADRFRRMHLIGALAFLPYGVCVDHFQHEVYANPDASPGRAACDVGAAGEDLHAVDRLRRSGLPAQGRPLAGEAAHLRLAVLLHRLHAGAVLRDAVLGEVAARLPRGDGGLCRSLRAGWIGAIPGPGAIGRAGISVRGWRAGGCGEGSRDSAGVCRLILNPQAPMGRIPSVRVAPLPRISATATH